jgi:hypothetical protein
MNSATGKTEPHVPEATGEKPNPKQEVKALLTFILSLYQNRILISFTSKYIYMRI